MAFLMALTRLREEKCTAFPRMAALIERRILPVTRRSDPFFFRLPPRSTRGFHGDPKKPLLSKFRSNISASSTLISAKMFFIKSLVCGIFLVFRFFKNYIREK
jgi:hypothetical protein